MTGFIIREIVNIFNSDNNLGLEKLTTIGVKLNFSWFLFNLKQKAYPLWRLSI